MCHCVCAHSINEFHSLMSNGFQWMIEYWIINENGVGEFCVLIVVHYNTEQVMCKINNFKPVFSRKIFQHAHHQHLLSSLVIICVKRYIIFSWNFSFYLQTAVREHLGISHSLSIGTVRENISFYTSVCVIMANFFDMFLIFPRAPVLLRICPAWTLDSINMCPCGFKTSR